MKKILLFTVMCVLGLFGTLKAQDVVTIDGTVGGFKPAIANVAPVNNYRDYSISQVYYTVDEIAKSSGTLTSISFKTETGDYPTTRNIDVYLLNTEEYYFSAQTTKAVTAQDLVFSGEVEFVENSWVQIDLDKDFEYTGGNLLVCVNDKTGVDGNRCNFHTFEGNLSSDAGILRRCLQKYNSSDDSSEFDPTSSIAALYDKNMPFIQLTFASGTAEEFLEPAAPTNFKVRPVSESKVNLTWDAAENAQYYEIIRGTEDVATDIEFIATNVTETSYFIKNLDLGTYNYGVRSVNGSKSSEYVYGSVELVRKDIDSIQIGQERTQTDIGDPVSSETVPFGFSMNMSSAYSWVEIPYSASLFEEGFSIDRISFDFEHGQEQGPAYLDEIRIYLAEKNKVNAAEWTAKEDLTLVYSDTDILIGEDKWEKFEFEESFEYKAKEDLIVVVATAKNGANVWTNRSSWYFDKVENNTLYRLGEDASFAQYPTEAGTQHYARPVVQFAWEVEEVIIEAPVLKATATSDTTVLLEWNAVDSAKGYSVYKNDSILLADYVDTTAYTVSGLEAETEYSFKVQAFNKYGDESEFSNTVNVKTLAKDGGATTPASPVVVTKVTNDSTVVLTWVKVEGAESYNVYQDSVMLKEALLDTTYTITDLKVDTTYTFEVTAVNEVGESKRAKVEVLIPSKEDEGDEGDEGGEENPTDTIVPVTIATPDTLIVEALSSSSIKLTWAAVEGATSYNVYVKDTLATTATDTTYTFENLDYNTEYCFAVAAVKDTLESAKTENVCKKTLGESIVELSASVNIYPNPVQDELFLATELNVKSISVYDIYGRQAMSHQVNESTSQQVVNVAELNTGIYFVKVVTNEGEIVKRFVKK